MKILKKLSWAIMTCLVAQVSFATADDSHTLKLILLNHSKQTLVYQGFSGENPGNHFKINHAEILPGQRAIITGTTLSTTDLAGVLHFKDGVLDNNELAVIDNRQFHTGNLILSLRNDHLSSAILDKKFNPVTDPHALCFVEAKVEITD